MTGQALISDFSLIVLKVGPVDSQLTASQLCAIVTEAETLILDQVRLAPCIHPGSRYQKEGEEYSRCGICSRGIEEDHAESLSNA